jgi:hypothetical protein
MYFLLNSDLPTILASEETAIIIIITQPFRAALGAESRVCYPDNTADRQTQ